MKKYIAYGSNINRKWMKEICPTAIFIDKAYILNSRITYRGQGHLNLEIDKSLGKVPIIIWSIDERSEKALDEYEDYPNYYRKENILIHTDKGNIESMIYLMNQKYENIKTLPSEEYINRVKEGYRLANFPIEILDEALKEVKL